MKRTPSHTKLPSREILKLSKEFFANPANRKRFLTAMHNFGYQKKQGTDLYVHQSCSQRHPPIVLSETEQVNICVMPIPFLTHCCEIFLSQHHAILDQRLGESL